MEAEGNARQAMELDYSLAGEGAEDPPHDNARELLGKIKPESSKWSKQLAPCKDVGYVSDTRSGWEFTFGVLHRGGLRRTHACGKPIRGGHIEDRPYESHKRWFLNRNKRICYRCGGLYARRGRTLE